MNPPAGWKFIGPYMVPVPKRILVAEIQRGVSDYYDLPARIMTDGSRVRAHARPRQVAMHLARHLTPRSLPEIGRLFKRDHTTVIHAVQQIDKLRAIDPQLQRDMACIATRLGA